ncbi:MAG: NUDIX hydrolase [Patescibacteria group bacterium]
MKDFYSNSSHVLIVDRKTKKILLTKRKDLKLWVMPGGHVEKKESFISAANREVKEEIGIDLNKLKLKLILKSKSNNIQKRVYISNIDSVCLNLNLSDEVVDTKWFNLNKLPRRMSLYEKKRVRLTYCSQKVIAKKLNINFLGEIFNWVYNQLFHPN